MQTRPPLFAKEMDVSRDVWHVANAVRKLSSRFRRPPPPRVSRRAEWPAISAVRPLFYAIRVFGLTPFEMFEDHLLPGIYPIVYSLFCAFFHTYLMYEILNYFKAIKRATVVLNYTENAKVIFNYFVLIVNLLVSATSVKKFISVINTLRQFDSRMRDLGHPRADGAIKFWSWFMFVVIVVLWIVVSRTGIAAFGDSFIFNVEYFVNYTATSMCVVKFSGIVILLGQRFKHLNNVTQLSKSSPSTPRRRSTPVDLRIIQRLHNGLMNASESLNSQYSWCLLLWLINLCMHTVSNLYFMINWLMNTPEWVATKWTLVNCVATWLVIYVSQLLLIHAACHFTSSEANGLGSIIVDWKPATIDRNYRVESTLHLINRRLNFSAAGCFHVNLPLLCSISGLLTTYLVLLLQLHN